MSRVWENKGAVVAGGSCRGVWLANVAAFLLGVPALAAAEEKAGPQTFDVYEFRVLGNTVLPSAAVETAVYSHLGPTRSLKDVEAARTDLETAYHKAGYGTVFVDIPPQSVEGGIVRLRVTEARLHSATVSGARYFSERQIKAEVPEATPGTVPNLPALQRQITDVNAESGDRTVVPVLKAGPVPGTVDLAMRVDDKLPFHGSLELNNQYTADTSPLRLLASLSYGDMFGRLDSLSMQYEGTPGKAGQVGVYAGNYTAHLDGSDSQLAFYVLHSSSDIAALGSLAILGAGTVYGARWVAPLTRTAALQQTFTAGIDYKDYSQVVNSGSTGSLNTPVTYTNLTAGYSEARSLAPLQLQWSVTGNFGPRDAPNNDLYFENKRFDAPADYFYLRADATLTLASQSKWQLILALDGQWTDQPLISNEQFSIGGAYSVRGYLETETLGDTGWRASLQPQTAPLHLGAALDVNAFLFADAARVITLDALPSDTPYVEIASVGGGLNLIARHCFTGNLTFADPLKTGPETHAHDARWLFIGRCAW
jgi:hemolysin activation/secretion protein